jgi:hypothetical protein
LCLEPAAGKAKEIASLYAAAKGTPVKQLSSTVPNLVF